LQLTPEKFIEQGGGKAPQYWPSWSQALLSLQMPERAAG
jgi:hypothetical protein